MRLTYRIIFIALTLACLPFLVEAQNKVGNGGNVVDCKTKHSQSPRLLDFYEADINPELVGKEAKEIAEDRFKLLKEAAPALGAQYLKRLSQIESEIAFKDDIEILPINDSNHLFKPLSENCKIIQVAVRNNKALARDKRFIIGKDLWNKMTATHQAGLLAHEIIHEHFTKLGETDSVKARRLNAHIFTDPLDKKKFWEFIKELEVSIYP